MPKQTKAAQQEQAEAIARLKEYIRPGDTVYCILRRVSASGMSRVIDLKIMHENEPLHIGYNAALALGYPYDRKAEGIKIGGCGMDMGFALVYELAQTLFPGNPPVNEKGRRVEPVTVGGYALKHRWL
jgi:hypothetical protein